MKEPSVVHSTFVLERSYPKPAAAVFAAFADAAKKRRWFADAAPRKAEEFAMDFREGGEELMRYRLGEETPFPGVEIRNEGRYQDIVPNERIVTASAMTLGGKRISVSLTTVELLPTETGTDLIFTHQGAFFEGSGGPEMREAGWKSLFEKLDREVAGK